MPSRGAAARPTAGPVDAHRALPQRRTPAKTRPEHDGEHADDDRDGAAPGEQEAAQAAEQRPGGDEDQRKAQHEQAGAQQHAAAPAGPSVTSLAASPVA
jgi:hypothetical protein